MSTTKQWPTDAKRETQREPESLDGRLGLHIAAGRTPLPFRSTRKRIHFGRVPDADDDDV